MRSRLTGLGLFAAVAIAGLTGCNDSGFDSDAVPPAAPSGVYTVTGSERVDIFWQANTEADLAGYRVWRSGSNAGPFSAIASVSVNAFTDRAVVNGVNYYYRITAFDETGNESTPSETYRDTPRPQGIVTLYAWSTDRTRSGFDFGAQTRVSYDCGCWDVALDVVNGVSYLSASVDADIQDAGYADPTIGLTKVDWVPDGGWSTSGTVEVVTGHAYIIWTGDGHFAALYARHVDAGGATVDFDWSYQLEMGNPELTAALAGARPQRRISQ